MPRYFIHMAYDGSAYQGWQIQPHAPTVQECMQEALSTLLRQHIKVVGAGRTDTGVHASSFVAHFDLPAGKPLDEGKPDPADPQFLFRLNRYLPADLAVYSIREVDVELHARFSARSRTYHYHISSDKALFARNYVHHVHGELDLPSIDACCRMLEDSSDFTSFARLHSDVKTHICKVERARWEKVEGGYLFEIRADRFLRNMVRSVVGTLLDVGLGRTGTEKFREIIEARDRSRAGQSAPAQALFLVEICYEGLPPFRAPIEAGP